MRPRKFAHSCFRFLVHFLLPKDNLFKNTFDFTTAGDWDFVAVVEPKWPKLASPAKIICTL